MAFKTLKNSLNDEFQREAQLMIKMKTHQNVVQLFGICLDSRHPIGIVTEYLELGSLNRLLANKTIQLDFIRIITIARDIAKGMRVPQSFPHSTDVL